MIDYTSLEQLDEMCRLLGSGAEPVIADLSEACGSSAATRFSSDANESGVTAIEASRWRANCAKLPASANQAQSSRLLAPSLQWRRAAFDHRFSLEMIWLPARSRSQPDGGAGCRAWQRCFNLRLHRRSRSFANCKEPCARTRIRCLGSQNSAASCFEFALRIAGNHGVNSVVAEARRITDRIDQRSSSGRCRFHGDKVRSFPIRCDLPTDHRQEIALR